MRRWNDPAPRRLDHGRASIEFLVFSVVLLVPVVFGITTLWAIQSAQIATEQASRDAVRAFTQQTSVPQATAIADDIARRVVAEHGVTTPIRLEYSCQASSCLTPGSLVRLRVTTDVRVFEAPFWGSAWPMEVTVDGVSAARVSVYGGSG